MFSSFALQIRAVGWQWRQYLTQKRAAWLLMGAHAALTYFATKNILATEGDLKKIALLLALNIGSCGIMPLCIATLDGHTKFLNPFGWHEYAQPGYLGMFIGCFL